MEKRARPWRPNLPRMDLTLSTCFIQVQDPDEPLTFYRDTLGLQVRNDVANEGNRWITVGSDSQPGVAIVLTNFVNGGPDDGNAVAKLLRHGAVKNAGAEIVQEPTEQFWGTKDFAVRDPSGNLVRIDQPPNG